MATEVKNYPEKLAEDDIKLNELNITVKSIEENLKILQSEINNCKDKILPDLTNQIESNCNDFKTEKDNIIKEVNDKIKGQLDEINKIKNQLEQLEKNYHVKYDEIEKNANELTEFEQKSQELKDEITQYYNEIFTGDNSFKVQLKNLYNDYIKKSNEINRLNNEIFITTNEKTDIIITKEEYNKLDANEQAKYQLENNQYIKFKKRISIKEQINTINDGFALKFKEFNTNATNSIHNNEEKNEKLRTELKNMIEGLVSGATTAGLAKSHEKAKNEHSTEIETWKFTFQGCILLMAFVLIIITLTVEFQFSLSGVIQRMFLIISVNFPLFWLAYLANKNINQNKRLYEEYLHKWAIAFSFDGMKREINELDPTDDKEYVKKLLEEFLNATALNPSSTLEKVQHTDNPMDKFTEIVKSDSQIKEQLTIDN